MVTDAKSNEKAGRAVIDRSFDKVHGTCPVCLRRCPLMRDGRLKSHPKKGQRRYSLGSRCVGSWDDPTTEPSLGGIVGGRETYELPPRRKAGTVINDPEASATAAQERYRAGAAMAVAS